MKVITIHLVDRLTECTTPINWTECVLCNGTIMANTHDSDLVWDSDSCYCADCGAVDTWSADGERAWLMRRPDEGPTIDVVREVFETAREIWEELQENWRGITNIILPH